MKTPKGISLIAHTGAGYYVGSYRTGVFSDNNQWNRQPKDSRKGWGFKLDFLFAWMLRPVPKFWRANTWRGKSKWLKIWEVIDKGNGPSYFGDKLYSKLGKKFGHENGVIVEPPIVPLDRWHDGKYSADNPWKGAFWFVLRVPPFIPLVFLSISTPWKSVYIGFKTYDVEPFLFKGPEVDQGDYTWCGGKERKICGNDTSFRAACPSATIRSDRS